MKFIDRDHIKRFMLFAAIIVVWLLFCTSIAVALHLNLQRTVHFSRYRDSLFSVLLSFTGNAPWEELTVSKVAELLLTCILLGIHLFLMAKWIALMVPALCKVEFKWVRGVFETSKRRLAKLVPVHENSEKPLLDPSIIKRYLPGLYYRVIVLDQEFRKLVGSAREDQSQAGHRNNKRDGPRNIEHTNQSGALESVVSDLKSRVHDVGDAVERGSKELSSRVNEMKNIISHINRRISGNSF